MNLLSTIPFQKLKKGRITPKLIVNTILALAGLARESNANRNELTILWDGKGTKHDGEYVPYIIYGVKRTKEGKEEAKKRNKGKRFPKRITSAKITWHKK